jgi:hypothetical protein
MRFDTLAPVGSGLALSAILGVAQAGETLTGTMTDAMCGKKHMMQDASAAKCTRRNRLPYARRRHRVWQTQ